MKKILFVILVFVLVFSFLFPNSLLSQRSVENLQKHVEFLASDSAQGRGIGTKRLDMVRNYIVRNFRNAGLKPLNYDFVLPFSGYTEPIRYDGYNIAGMLEGSDDSLKNEIIVIGAHYDHLGTKGEKVFNGANDNASGVALLMELAFELKRMKNQIKRSILFIAFDAEEAGLVGSFDFIKSDSTLLKKIQMMFSFDMVGTYKDSRELILTGFDLLKTSPNYCSDIATINDITIKTNNKFESRTDTYPFLKQGITSVHVTTGMDKYYHTSKDTPEKLDYEGMAKILNFSTDLILKLNSEDNKIFARVSDISEVKLIPTFRYGFFLGFGSSYFNYVNKYYQAKSEFALNSGLVTELNIFKHISLSTGINYSLSESKHQYGTYRAHSLEIPLNIIASTSSISVPVGFSVVAGGFYSKHFLQTVTRNNVDTKDIFRDYDVGMNLGFSIYIMNVQIGWLSKMGFYDQHLDKLNDRIWMNRFLMTFTYFK